MASALGFVLLGMAETRATDDATSFSSSDFLTQAGNGADTGPARIKYLADSGVVELANGAVVRIDGMDVVLTVSPYPPSDFDVDIELSLTDESGEVITDAVISADWDMAFMWHGPFHTDFIPSGNGVYRASFDLFMFGPWEFETRIATPGTDQHRDLTFSIYTWPE